MAIKIGAWNLREGLALPEHSSHLVEAILQRDNDVMILSDAYWLGNPLHDAQAEVAEDALDVLRLEGYQAVRTDYEDDLPWPERYMVALLRVAVSDLETVRLGGRNALGMQIVEPHSDISLNLLGAHFDDRNETNRMMQAYDASEYLQAAGSAAIIGDLNALHGPDGRSKFLGSHFVGSAVACLPHERAKNIGKRVHEMALDSSFDILRLRGFRDVDPLHRPTFPSRAPLLHLDRCFVSDQAIGRDFAVAPHNSHSDHRAIEVVIEA